MDTPETRVEYFDLVPLTLMQRSSLLYLLDKAQEEWGAAPGDDALRATLQAPDADPKLDAARKEAVGHLRSILDTFINDRCVTAEGEEQERGWFRDDLRALGVTDAEIEAWT